MVFSQKKQPNLYCFFFNLSYWKQRPILLIQSKISFLMHIYTHQIK